MANEYQTQQHKVPGFSFGNAKLVSPEEGRRYAESQVIDESKIYNGGRPLWETPPQPKGEIVAAVASNTVQGPASIVELTRALKNDPQLIYQFVHDQIEWEPGWGVQKGALGCVMDGMGNAFDQCMLMVACLRQAGYTANYAQGTIQISQAAASAWFNTESTDIWGSVNYCANMNIPATDYWDGSQYWLQMSHVWVQCVISGTTYVFDPSYKTYTRKTGMSSSSLASALGYTASTFLSDAESGATIDTHGNYVANMNRTNIRSDLKTFAGNLASYIKSNTIGSATPGTAQIDDILGGQAIVPVTIPQLNTSLSYEKPGDTPTIWTGDVPTAYKTTLEVMYPNGSGGWSIDQTFTSDQLAGGRLTLFFDGSLHPVLYLNGTAVQTGNAQGAGTWNSVQLIVTHNAYSGYNFTWWQSYIYAGEYYLIANAWGNLGRGQFDYHQQQLNANVAAGGSSTSEPVLGEALSAMWFYWAGENSRAADLINRIMACHTMYNHQVGIVGHNLTPLTDLGGISGSTTNLNNDTTKTPINDTVLSMHGVALEATMIQQIPQVQTGVCTTKIIDTANRSASITISGTVTVGDTLTITVHDTSLSGGTKSDSYTTVTGDTLTSIAAALATTINGDSSLAAIGVTASSSGAVLMVTSNSGNMTTYTSSTSGGATETITIAFVQIYVGNGTNWAATVSPALSANGYATSDLNNIHTWYISYGDQVLIPAFPSQTVGEWFGWGYWALPTSGGFGIINGIKGGTGGNPQAPGTTVDNSSDSGWLEPGFSTPEDLSGEPIDMATGNYVLYVTDISLGSQDYPYQLNFTRRYNSRSQYTNGPLGRGWTHDFAISARVSSDGFAAMGSQYSLQAVASITELYVTCDIMSDSTRPVAKLVTASLADEWWVDELTQNSVVVTYGSGSQIYLQLPDGTYAPPLDNSNTLTLSGGLYVLTTKYGVAYNFNSSGQISTVVYPNGVTVTFSYTSGVLTSVTNGMGRTLTLNYTSGYISSVTDGTGRSVGYTVDSNPNLTTVTDPNSENTTYSYDNPGRLTKIFKPANPTTPIVTNVYDSLSRVETQTDANSNLWTYYFAGSRAEEVNPNSYSTISYFDRNGSILSLTDALGNETVYSYDGLERLTQLTLPEGNYFTYAYDSNNNVLTYTAVPKSGSGLSNVVNNFTYDTTWKKVKTAEDGNLNTTTYGYSSSTGNLLTIQRPTITGVTPTVNYFYNSRGQVVSAIDETGIQTQFNYDSTTEKLTSQVANTNWLCTVGGSITVGDTLTITAHDTHLSGGQESVSHTVITGDTLGSIAAALAAAVNADSHLAALGIVGYSSGSVVSLATAAPGNTTTYTESTSIGATETLTLSNGLALTTNYGYDSVGNVNALTDPNTNETTFVYDNKRRMTQRTAPSPLSYVTNYSYDANDNLTQVENQTSGASILWQIFGYTYSAADQLLTVTDPTGHVTTYTYDTIRRLLTKKDALLQTTTYAYDADNRLYTVTDPSLTVSDTRTYSNNGLVKTIKDANINVTTYAYDGFDRLYTRTYQDSSYEECSSYDANGNVLTYQTRSGNTIVMTYDVLNRLSTKAPTSQPTVTLGYDLAGRLTSASKPVVSGDPSSGELQFFFDTAGRFNEEEYPDSKTVTHVLDSNGNITQTTYPDGYYVNRAYDQLNRLSTIKLNGSSTAAVSFTYDALSRRTQISYANGVVTNYTFALDNDLTTLAHTFVGSALSFTLGYNAVRQIVSQGVTNESFMWHPSAGGTTTYATANTVNEYPTVGGASYSYDGNANLSGDGTWTYSYDTENHLLSASKTGTSASYIYDPVQRQTQKTVGTTETRFIYSGLQHIADYDGVAGTLLNRYVHGTKLDEPLIQISSGGTVTYFSPNQQGSVVAVTNSSGAVTNSYAYGPYGESAAISGTTFGFNAQRYDAETGLYYYKSRYYSPTIGRFLQPDRIGYYEGLNLYTYVNNDPLNWVDPLGLATDSGGPDDNGPTFEGGESESSSESGGPGGGESSSESGGPLGGMSSSESGGPFGHPASTSASTYGMSEAGNASYASTYATFRGNWFAGSWFTEAWYAGIPINLLPALTDFLVLTHSSNYGVAKRRGVAKQRVAKQLTPQPGSSYVGTIGTSPGSSYVGTLGTSPGSSYVGTLGTSPGSSYVGTLGTSPGSSYGGVDA